MHPPFTLVNVYVQAEEKKKEIKRDKAGKNERAWNQERAKKNCERVRERGEGSSEKKQEITRERETKILVPVLYVYTY